MKKTTYLDGMRILSYNAIINEIDSNRNFGKTWCFLKRAFKRGLKKGKKTLYVRTFKKEIKEAVQQLYQQSDLQKFCGIEFYDPKTKKGNFKKVGRTFYVKRQNKWMWFMRCYAVSDANAVRSCDDPEMDTIIYEEYRTTAQQEKHFRGNRIDLFIDMFFTAKRNHKVTIILLGNRENAVNPFCTYFGIPQQKNDFEGIKTFKNGSYLICQINNKQQCNNNYDEQVQKLFKGTVYGRYLYENEAKGQSKLHLKKPPAEAFSYVQLHLNGYDIHVKNLGGTFYINDKIDKNKPVYVLERCNKYKIERILLKRYKSLFTSFINAVASNNVFYNSHATYAAIQPFYKWLNI